MSATYTTRDEAVLREVVEPLGEYVSEHDVQAIADEVLGDHAEGYACVVTEAEFWAVVERHAL